jgi:uncharacterized protein YdeI (YjbR/CyaY-like superfamily)
MELKNGIATFYAASRQDWRNWLEQNAENEISVWLIIHKKASPQPSIYYPEAVDEALCFGWIDSKANKRDEFTYYQFFSKRKPKSNWSKVNKIKVAQLIEQGLMRPSGLKMIEHAKSIGTWDALNEVEEIRIPDEMQKFFDEQPVAFQHWNLFSRSVKRGILEWILIAKRPETRTKRIVETVSLAAENKKANQFRP